MRRELFYVQQQPTAQHRLSPALAIPASERPLSGLNTRETTGLDPMRRGRSLYGRPVSHIKLELEIGRRPK